MRFSVELRMQRQTTVSVETPKASNDRPALDAAIASQFDNMKAKHVYLASVTLWAILCTCHFGFPHGGDPYRPTGQRSVRLLVELPICDVSDLPFPTVVCGTGVDLGRRGLLLLSAKNETDCRTNRASPRLEIAFLLSQRPRPGVAALCVRLKHEKGEASYEVAGLHLRRCVCRRVSRSARCHCAIWPARSRGGDRVFGILGASGGTHRCGNGRFDRIPIREAGDVVSALARTPNAANSATGASISCPRSVARSRWSGSFGGPVRVKRVAIGMVSVLSLVGCAQRGGKIATAAQPAPVVPLHSSVLPAEIQRVSPESGKPFVYVSREVQLPGCYVWTEGMTLTDVIEAAGGLTPFAGSRIRISHVDGTTEVYHYGQIKKHGSRDPLLRAGDRVWVKGDLL
jgi:hypothetical protein